jgi:hypothetical protein
MEDADSASMQVVENFLRRCLRLNLIMPHCVAQETRARASGYPQPNRVTLTVEPFANSCRLACGPGRNCLAQPIHRGGEVTVRCVIANSAALQLLTVMRTIAALKSKLQRTNPVELRHKYNQMFSELVVLEARRKALHTRSIGPKD